MSKCGRRVGVCMPAIPHELLVRVRIHSCAAVSTSQQRALELSAVLVDRHLLSKACPVRKLNLVTASYFLNRRQGISAWINASADRQTWAGSEEFRSKMRARLCDSARACAMDTVVWQAPRNNVRDYANRLDPFLELTRPTGHRNVRSLVHSKGLVSLTSRRFDHDKRQT
jgi:hypothetical protein